MIAGIQEFMVRARMKAEEFIRAHETRAESYDDMLRRHYAKGWAHPDDVNKPLNEWNNEKTDNGILD